MHILIAPDSFKESLSAMEVAEAIQAGFSKVYPQATYDLLPVGDGGEGTVSSLIQALSLEWQTVEVTGPFGTQEPLLYARKGEVAVLEMAALVGLALIPPEKRNPLCIHTQGIGEWIRHVMAQGAKRILIGIGGSASHDGGIGMAAGLGVRFYDCDGKEVEAIGANVGRIASYSTEGVPPGIEELTIELVTDVSNPLCGEMGATYVFAGQKGLASSAFARVDEELQRFYQWINPAVLTVAGAGAGGGMAAGLMQFAGAHIRHGIDFVLDQLNFDQRVQRADLVIVGEGRLDRQSLAGKTPIGVARRTPQTTPVVAICGSLEPNLPSFPIGNLRAAFPILSEVKGLKETLGKAEENLVRTAEQVARLLELGGELGSSGG